MGRSKWIGLVTALVFLTFGGGSKFPAAAQDGGLSAEAQALLAVVSTAYDNTLAAGSLRTLVSVEVSQTLAGGSGRGAVQAQQRILQESKGDYVLAGDSLLAATTTRQSLVLTVGATEYSSTLLADVRLLEAETYVRFSAPEASAAPLPQGWQQPGDLPDDDAARVLLSFHQVMIFPTLNADTVLGINEGAGDTLNGQAMRVFTVRASADALANTGLGDGALLSGMVTALRDTSLFGLGDQRTEIVLRVWVGGEDGLIHQVNMTTRTNAGIIPPLNTDAALTLTQRVDSSVVLYDFGAEIGISAPAEGE